MNPTDPVASCHRYFDAWRARDAAAVLATLAPGGRYEDPLTGGPIAGDALRGYMQGLWAAFPDLDFELGEVHRVGDATVHGSWTMTGHNSGSFHGLPPTGRAVRAPGIDVIRVGADGIEDVRGYFDSAAVPRQLTAAKPPIPGARLLRLALGGLLFLMSLATLGGAVVVERAGRRGEL